jgi:hypothetical protein
MSVAMPLFPTDAAEGMDVDDAALRLQGLRKRGSGISVRNKPPTTARMTRILKLLGITPSLHGAWSGLSLKDWLKTNPTWTEQEWARLVAENFDRIQETTVNTETER